MKKVLLTVAVVLAHVESIAGYEFHLLADNTQSIIQGTSGIALNNSGTVAYLENNAVYLVESGSEPTLLYGPDATRPNGESLLISSIEIDINDFGEVVFEAETFLESSGIFSGDGGALTEHIFSNFEAFESPSINNMGSIAFVGDQLYRSDGLTATSVNSFSVIPFSAEINEADEIVFYGYSFESDASVILTDTGVTIAEEGSEPYANLYGNVTWNSSGVAVFSAQTENSAALFSGDGEITTVIAEDVLLGGSSVRAAINESGDILFADTFTGTLFLYSGADGTTEQLLSEGDIIDGKVVSSLFFGRHGFNDAAEIALLINFTNGESSVYLAQPVPVPAAMWLFISAAGVIRLWRHFAMV